jgi:hypothetical protein
MMFDHPIAMGAVVGGSDRSFELTTGGGRFAMAMISDRGSAGLYLAYYGMIIVSTQRRAQANGT